MTRSLDEYVRAARELWATVDGPRAGVSDADIAEFEKRHSITLPHDVIQYFQIVDGMAEALVDQQVFDEADLIRELQELPVPSRVAFAAASAERLFPAYAVFSKAAARGDSRALSEILERVWKILLGARMDLAQLQVDLERSMALVPGEDDEPWVDEQAYADDAASAIAYTLRTLESGEPQEAAWAALRAYDAIDHHVTHRLGIDAEDQVAGHPAVQAELLRQRRDLDELRASGQNTTSAIGRLRDRARVDGKAFFCGS